ncbi:hypothetical protein L1049_007306 [Liquidambar formosana]|uniref:Uncharacterized protein n=1 Tax=Liquidambar formosana TaxID=63359 RepID=A0AAP0RGZ6_LIQFO
MGYTMWVALPTLMKVGSIPGTVPTLTPKKQGTNDSGEGRPITNEKTDPVFAFNKPPPLLPVIGPLVVLLLLETWSSRDSNDD